MPLICVKLLSASKRGHVTHEWQQPCKDVQLLRCILVYWGYCQWGNCYLHRDGFLPVWSLNAGVKRRLWEEAAPLLFDSEGQTPKPDTSPVRCLRIIFRRQTRRWKYLDALSRRLVWRVICATDHKNRLGKYELRRQFSVLARLFPPGMSTFSSRSIRNPNLTHAFYNTHSINFSLSLQGGNKQLYMSCVL